jgi:uncharacterized protein YdeI (YjbR/CyaY-like superfamily)
MHSSGLKLFEERKIKQPGVYSYENKPENLPEYMQEILKTNAAALAFYNSCPPSYRRTALFWILSARQEQTRLSRLDKFIQLCAEGKRMYI